MERIKNIWNKIKSMKKERIIVLICGITIIITVIISSILFVSAMSTPEESSQETPTEETQKITQYIPYSPDSPKSLQYQSLGDGTCTIVSIGKYSGEDLDIPERSPQGETVVGISSNAFDGCEELVSVNIPSTISEIGDDVFKGCSSLVAITVERSNPKFSSSGGILYSKSKELLICYPAARIGNSYLLNPNVKVIASNAFFGVRNLTKINYEGTTTEFGQITVHEGNKIFTSLPITCNYSASK